jgi:putative FmdB family regulatory protein
MLPFGGSRVICFSEYCFVPLYEYRCKSCQHRFEKIQKFSDALVRLCPKCGKEAVEQTLSAPAVQFKGSGWYVNDYARKGAAPESAAAKGNGSPAPASAASSESKPAPSGDSKPAAPAKEASS